MSETANSPRKDQIIAAAEHLFRERGYLATSVRDIGAEVGIRGASLYHHVGSKEELLWLSASRAADAFFNALQPVMASDEPPTIKLRKAVIAHVGVITSHLDASAVYFNEWRHLGADQRLQFAAKRDAYETMFRNLLEEGIRAGIFAPVDEKFAARLVLSALNWTHQWYRPDGPMTPKEIGETLAEMLLNGLLRTA